MRTLLIILLTLPGGLLAQRPAPATPAAIGAIREADLRRDLFAMASPAMRGREGGTVDEMRASIWVAEQYRRIGLKPAGDDGTWFQWFTITRTRVSVASSRATIAGRSMTLFGDVIPLGVAPVEATGPVPWLANPEDTTIDLRGRIVATMLRAPQPGSIRPTSYPAGVRYANAAIAGTLAPLARRGAAAILLVANAPVDSVFEAVAVMRQRGDYDVDRATPRAAGQPDRVAPPPALGAGATPALLVRASMAATLPAGAEVVLGIRLERFETPSVNVIGSLRGTDPKLRDEYVLYSSHQDANGVRLLVPGDSVLAGADDNASVSVAEFAAARAFVAQRPKRSLLFVHHGAEERGLLGSRYHSAHPVVPLGQIVVVLNGDMIGRNHPDTVALLGAQPNLPYARLGIPGLMYSTNLHDDYHTADDIPERIDYAKLTRMARWMYLTGWYAANAARRSAVDAGFRLERSTRGGGDDRSAASS